MNCVDAYDNEQLSLDWHNVEPIASNPDIRMPDMILESIEPALDVVNYTTGVILRSLVVIRSAFVYRPMGVGNGEVHCASRDNASHTAELRADRSHRYHFMVS